jgi:signal transduction histidine kinase
MAAAVVLALGGATVLARRQASRLADPVVRLARQAVDLGRGDFTTRAALSGIEEVDVVATALDDSAARLADLLARERSFSADVSHQLRTPLTGLRLRLERARADAPSEPHVQDALDEIGRLEATVEHLLALSRDRHPVGAPLDVTEVLAAALSRWRPRYQAARRELQIDAPRPRVVVRASNLSIGQVLDVLLDNALRHGSGTVTLRARAAAGGLVIEVSDEGPGIAEDRRDRVFDRHEGHGSGIGLALARSITEAEGGRLLLASGRPPCFQVVLPATE